MGCKVLNNDPVNKGKIIGALSLLDKRGRLFVSFSRSTTGRSECFFRNRQLSGILFTTHMSYASEYSFHSSFTLLISELQLCCPKLLYVLFPSLHCIAQRVRRCKHIKAPKNICIVFGIPCKPLLIAAGCLKCITFVERFLPILPFTNRKEIDSNIPAFLTFTGTTRCLHIWMCNGGGRERSE